MWYIYTREYFSEIIDKIILYFMLIIFCFYMRVSFLDALILFIFLIFLASPPFFGFDIRLSTFTTFYNVLRCFTICYKRFTLYYDCITCIACCCYCKLRFLTMCAHYVSGQSVRLIALIPS